MEALHVLAEGPGWVVVAKPPRLLVHRNAFNPKADAALQRVRTQMKRRVYPIHRLDSAVSGCLLFATERDLAGPLSAALSAATKTYVALGRGAWRLPEREVVAQTPMKDERGALKEARSLVRCLGSGLTPRCCLLEVRPQTGRFHQVRRHARDLHHPLLLDNAHGDSRENRYWREERGLPRLALHCLSLSLTLPGGEPLDAVCPLFEDHAAVYRALPFWEEAAAACPDLARPPLPLPQFSEPPSDNA